MSSTRPITSGRRGQRSGAGRFLLLAAIVALAAAVLVFGVREVHSAFTARMGLTALAEAENLQRGPERDRKLDDAQRLLLQARAAGVDSGEAWLGLARVNYLQATAATFEAVSPTLLDAARAAAAEARARLPENALVAAREGEILAAYGPASAGKAAEALAASYRMRKNADAALAAIRVPLGAALWASLDKATRNLVLDDGCAYKTRGGAAGLDALVTASAAQPELQGALLRLKQAEACGAGS